MFDKFFFNEKVNVAWSKGVNTLCTRERNDQNKIRIPHKYRKGNCLYKLIDTWNKSNNDYKMAGNDWSLKKMIKSNILDNLEICAQKNCEICKFDASRDFIKYMSA